MKYFFFIILICNIFLGKTIYSAESYVVLKVNNNIITNIDIDNEFRYLMALNKDLKNIDKKIIIKLAKDSIIREKIKETELMNYFDLNQENKYIDRIMKNFYIKLGLKNEKDFINYLESYKLLYKDVKMKISIEAAWNDLVYKRYSNNIIINEEEIKKNIKKLINNNNKQYAYSLSEIIFTSDKSENAENTYQLIKKSISEIGFKNTANIYSESDSSKHGGKIGWINEGQLSELIKKEIVKLKIDEHTRPITVPGGQIILYLNDKKQQERKLNFEEEFKKQILFEKNKQLNQFSKIYFNKIKKNSTISEN
jgi:peptidyl-prolyl cis-trans isomerase SurA